MKPKSCLFVCFSIIFICFLSGSLEWWKLYVAASWKPFPRSGTETKSPADCDYLLHLLRCWPAIDNECKLRMTSLDLSPRFSGAIYAVFIVMCKVLLSFLGVCGGEGGGGGAWGVTFEKFLYL